MKAGGIIFIILGILVILLYPGSPLMILGILLIILGAIMFQTGNKNLETKIEEMKDKAQRIPCPFCKEPILKEALKCRYCGADIPPEIRPQLKTGPIKKFGELGLWKCEVCGTLMNPETVSCNKCYAPKMESAVRGTNEDQDGITQVQIKKKSYKIAPFILLSILGIMVSASTLVRLSESMTASGKIVKYMVFGLALPDLNEIPIFFWVGVGLFFAGLVGIFVRIMIGKK
jgi:hypothetical protein